MQRNHIGFLEQSRKIHVLRAEFRCKLFVNYFVVVQDFHTEPFADAHEALSYPTSTNNAYFLLEKVESKQSVEIEVAFFRTIMSFVDFSNKTKK